MEFVNWFTFEACLKLALMCWGGGGGGEEGSKTVVPKIPRVVCLSHPCTFRHSSVFCGEGRQIRPAELGKQPEF